MDKITYNISDSEWLIMNVLWEDSPLSSTKIISSLSEETSWNPKTIHSLIDRLVKKEIVGVNKQTTPFEFYPLVDKNDCAMKEAESFLQKVYNGSLKLMLTNFIKNEKISESEIDELQRLFNESIDSKNREDK